MTQVNYSTQFVVASTGEILTISQIMASDKTISIPVGIGAEGMRNSGFIMVRPTDRPSGDVVVQDVPVLNADGYYDQAWSVREYTSEEKAARFEQERQDMLGAIIALRSNAESNGAPIRIGGEVYRLSLIHI